jgi:hypothetical protein
MNKLSWNILLTLGYVWSISLISAGAMFIALNKGVIYWFMGFILNIGIGCNFIYLLRNQEKFFNEKVEKFKNRFKTGWDYSALSIQEYIKEIFGGEGK